MSKKNLLYFDTEWVPISPTFEDLQKDFPLHADGWTRRCEKLRIIDKVKYRGTDAEIYKRDAGGYPEYIKMICISAGYYKGEDWKISSFYGDDENLILSAFAELLSKTAGKYILCGKAIKRYDLPFLAKRMAINGINIPYDLNNAEKKPWDIHVVDIGEMWGFGCNQETYTTLDWICISLGIPTSKDGINAADIAEAYWNENRLEEIKDYCERDVKVTADVEQRITKLTT